MATVQFKCQEVWVGEMRFVIGCNACGPTLTFSSRSGQRHVQFSPAGEVLSTSHSEVAPMVHTEGVA